MSLTYPRAASGKQAGRLPLPLWLRQGVQELLCLEFAVAMGDPSLVPTLALQRVVLDADPLMRQRARHYLLGHGLAPHARWATEGRETPELTIPELEALLTGLAEDGDRAAVLALLAARDPARYGRHAAAADEDPEAVDTVDFAPKVIGG